MSELEPDFQKMNNSSAIGPVTSASNAGLTEAQPQAFDPIGPEPSNELVNASPGRPPSGAGGLGTQTVPALELGPQIPAPMADDQTYEGTVKLCVEAPSLRQMLQFVDEICQRPEMRLLKLVSNGQQRIGLDIWLALREQLNLRS